MKECVRFEYVVFSNSAPLFYLAIGHSADQYVMYSSSRRLRANCQHVAMFVFTFRLRCCGKQKSLFITAMI